LKQLRNYISKFKTNRISAIQTPPQIDKKTLAITSAVSNAFAQVVWGCL